MPYTTDTMFKKLEAAGEAGDEEAVAFFKELINKNANTQRTKGVTAGVSPKQFKEEKAKVEKALGRKPNDSYYSFMGRLQEKYGDESTKYGTLSTGFLPKKIKKFDEAELLKRAARDQWGTTPPTPGAFATLGKMMVDVGWKGPRQLLPKDWGGLSEEEIEDMRTENLIWQAAEHPASSELGAMALTMAPSLGTMPLLYTGAGRLAGSQTLKGIGESAARRQAGMVNFPKTAAAIGGAYGAALPHDPDATPTEAVYQRLMSGLQSGVINYGASQLMHLLPDAIRTSEAISRRNKLQADLPKKVNEKVFDLYGSSQARNKFNEFVGVKSPTGDRATAAQNTFMNTFRDSTNKVLEDMVGTSTPKPIGARMNDIMDKFFEVYRASKTNMDSAFKAIPNEAKLIVTNKGPFLKFAKELQAELKAKNLSMDGPIKEVFTEFNRLGNKKNKPITFVEVRQFMKKLNKAQQRVFNDEAKKDLRPAITELKSRVTNYIENELWRDIGTRGGVPGKDNLAVQAWKNANDVARKHYEKFHGTDILDETLDQFNRTGKKDISPTDIAEELFVGSVQKMDRRTQPRVQTLNKIRGALKGMPDFNVERALKEEAINTLRAGGAKGKDEIDTLLSGVENNVLQGVHSDLFNPKGYGGQPGLFNTKEFAQLEQLVNIKRRATDPGVGSIKSTVRDETQIPNTLGGRLLNDFVINEYGPYGTQTAGKLGEILKNMAPTGIRNMSKKRLDDRIIRRYTSGIMGNYGPQIPAPLLGPMATSISNEPMGGQLANPTYEDNKVAAEYFLRNYPTLQGLFNQGEK